MFISDIDPKYNFLCYLWYHDDASLIYEFGIVSSSSVFWNNLKRIGINSSLKVL